MGIVHDGFEHSAYILDALHYLYKTDPTLWELAYSFDYDQDTQTVMVETNTYGSLNAPDSVTLYIFKDTLDKWTMRIVPRD